MRAHGLHRTRRHEHVHEHAVRARKQLGRQRQAQPLAAATKHTRMRDGQPLCEDLYDTFQHRAVERSIRQAVQRKCSTKNPGQRTTAWVERVLGRHRNGVLRFGPLALTEPGAQCQFNADYS